MILDKLKEIYSGPLEPYMKNIVIPAIESKIDYDKEIAKLNLQLKRAKEAYLKEIDTMEEYKENKTRITKEISAMKISQQKDNKIVQLDQAQFKSKLLNVVTLIESDADMSEKIVSARSLIEKIYIDPHQKTIDLFFYA